MLKSKKAELGNILHSRMEEYVEILESKLFYPSPPERKRPSKYDLECYEKSKQTFANKYYNALKNIFLWEFDIPNTIFFTYGFVIEGYHLNDLLINNELYVEYRSALINYLVNLVQHDLLSKEYKLRTSRSKLYLDNFGDDKILDERNRITFIHKPTSIS